MFCPILLSPPLSFTLQEKKIDTLFRGILDSVTRAQNGSINIAFLPDTDIQKLNHQYRHIDQTTDVLSFHYFEDFSGVAQDEIAGEILLSESRIRDQAKTHGHTPEKEVLILILHGTLHILGYDHETDEEFAEMWSTEKKLREMLDERLENT